MNEQNNYQQPVEQNFQQGDQQPAPQYQQPAPQYQQPAPQYQQPALQYQQPAPQYQQPYGQQFYGPVRQLNTHRGLIKLILLTIITFGIYPLVFFSGISEDINLIASRFDGRKTMHYCLMAFIIGPLTLGIGFIVWFHNLSSRMGNELARRGIAYSFGASSYWLWNVLGSLIIIGPFVYLHKLARASVLLAEDYNIRG